MLKKITTYWNNTHFKGYWIVLLLTSYLDTMTVQEPQPPWPQPSFVPGKHTNKYIYNNKWNDLNNNCKHTLHIKQRRRRCIRNLTVTEILIFTDLVNVNYKNSESNVIVVRSINLTSYYCYYYCYYCYCYYYCYYYLPVIKLLIYRYITGTIIKKKVI